jgi:hypothetical protein
MSSHHIGPITTEQHWLDSGDPEEMARLLETGDHDPRRWQMFACACCWRILPMLDDRSRQAVAVAERLAEVPAFAGEIENASHLAHSAVLALWRAGTNDCLAYAAMAAHYALIRPRRVYAYAALAAGSGQDAERRVQADLLRDVFGNPFRAVRLDAAWRTPTVLAIAEDIYHNDTYSEMPVLGDALEDAGCDDLDVLDHARLARPHVRGCWLIDGLLARNAGVDSP